ncbi:FabD/lysophospholipase-like protein [Atractiella rhizophila]|nr:FabD/lysophospholipase-like protein [Atractiella rhizophila]
MLQTSLISDVTITPCSLPQICSFDSDGKCRACGYRPAGTCRPCDFFDLICGSSGGGFIALLLGRLGLTAKQALDVYSEYGLAMFPDTGPPLKAIEAMNDANRKKASGAMEQAILRILSANSTDLSMDPKSLLLRDSDHRFEDRCRVFVTASYNASWVDDELFRTYKAAGFSSPKCTFLQACMATAAFPGLFEPVEIDHTEYLAGVNDNSNPTILALAEIKRIWGPHADFSCLVSIGSGREPRVKLGTSTQTSVDVVETLATATLRSTRISNSVKLRLTVMEKEHRYFRFDEDGGLEMSVERWRDKTDIIGAARAYMANQETEAKEVTWRLSRGMTLHRPLRFT